MQLFVESKMRDPLRPRDPDNDAGEIKSDRPFQIKLQGLAEVQKIGAASVDQKKYIKMIYLLSFG
jgi:hypothetical protein